jgi:hypothetical protein
LNLADVWLENNLARARLVGTLRLTGTNARLGVLGTVETAEGSEAYFRNNQFAITRGSIEFHDRYGIDPTFDLRAQSQVREYLVKLHAFGRPAAPQVLFTSEPSLTEGDVLSLLTLGVTSSDRGDGGVRGRRPGRRGLLEHLRVGPAGAALPARQSGTPGHVAANLHHLQRRHPAGRADRTPGVEVPHGAA